MNAVTERYTLTSELGRGGMATVHRAHDARHGRDVAVKVMLPSVAQSLGAERFLREIETAARLQHSSALADTTRRAHCSPSWSGAPTRPR